MVVIASYQAMSSLMLDKEDKTLNESELEVQRWMVNILKLPQYFQLFIDNGYDEIETIMEMDDKELQDIGINKKGHRKKILRYIRKGIISNNASIPQDQEQKIPLPQVHNV